MRVAIVGSRIRSAVMERNEVNRLIDKLDTDDIVVSGGCWGVDSWAVDQAKRVGMKTVVFKPMINDTMDYGMMVKEYYRRNREVVDNSDMVYAFVSKDGIKKGGTWYTIEYARKQGKKVVIL